MLILLLLLFFFFFVNELSVRTSTETNRWHLGVKQPGNFFLFFFARFKANTVREHKAEDITHHRMARKREANEGLAVDDP